MRAIMEARLDISKYAPGAGKAMYGLEKYVRESTDGTALQYRSGKSLGLISRRGLKKLLEPSGR